MRVRFGDIGLNPARLFLPFVRGAEAISIALNPKIVRLEALEATLNALTAGVYLTDRQARIIFMNDAAEEQVKRSAALRIENNRLVPADPVAQAALTKAIAGAIGDEAARPAGRLTLALPDRRKAGFVATVLPLDSRQSRYLWRTSTAAVAIFVKDPAVTAHFPDEAFARLYGLTGGELRVLVAMAPGLAVKEAAEILGISETTAKTHLQHIYIKTGTSKQTELMHLFMNSIPPVKAVVQRRRPTLRGQHFP